MLPRTNASNWCVQFRHVYSKIGIVVVASNQQDTQRCVFFAPNFSSRTIVAGEGLHPTVQPLAWWLERISRVGKVSNSKAEGRYVVGRFMAKEGCGCA